MQTIDEYFKKIQEIIANSRIVASTKIEYTKVLEHEGYMQGTLTLIDGSELRILEYTSISRGKPTVLRYRFQWQTAEELIARWNNAPHHPEVESFPHHKHVKGEDKPKPSRVTSLISVLKEIEAEILSKG
ncbi:MAG: hypothetical protein AOA66_0765 [Candidatus Bathyarchaeota archaeon BA2]|nr:MAG: hypothetical protein AOA66_0765 [Candidatus Bathyarchaeota archaeon BA2]